jgi:hypothetical protein
MFRKDDHLRSIAGANRPPPVEVSQYAACTRQTQIPFKTCTRRI